MLTKEEYLKIKEMAKNDALKSESLTTSLEKYNYAYQNAQNLFDNINSDSAGIYICTFIIPNDEEFITTCKQLNNNLTKVAKHYELDPKISLFVTSSKMMEINKYYSKYIYTNNTSPAIQENEEKREQPQEKSEIDLLKEQLLLLKEENSKISTEKQQLEQQNNELTRENINLKTRIDSISKILPILQEAIEIPLNESKKK